VLGARTDAAAPESLALTEGTVARTVNVWRLLTTWPVYVHWTLVLAIYLVVGLVYTTYLWNHVTTDEAREQVTDLFMRTGFTKSGAETFMQMYAVVLWPFALGTRIYDKLNPVKDDQDRYGNVRKPDWFDGTKRRDDDET